MAVGDKAQQNAQTLETLLDKLKRSQQEQERSSTKLGKAMDDLSQSTVDVLMKSMKDAAKQTGILSDEQLSLIKTHKELNDAIEHQEKLAEKAIPLQEAYNKAIAKANDLSKTNSKLGEREADLAKTAYNMGVEELKLNADQADQLIASTKAFKDATEKQIEAAESMNYFAKHVDNATSAMSSWAKKTFSLGNAFDLIKQGVVGSIDDLNKATAVGLQGSFQTIQAKATSLWMSFDEFSEVISKNRDVLRQFGGGAQSVEKFADLLQKASEPLNYMGKEGTKATARFFETLRVSGIAAGRDPELFASSMAATQKEFKKYTVLYGDNAESFADLVESQLSGASTQAVLIGMNVKQSSVIREEVMARINNLKQLGLSNEQIKEFNTTLENLYDPNKNNQEQKIQEGAMGQAYADMLAKMNPEDKDMQVALPLLKKYFEMQMSGATPDQLKDYMSTNASAFKAFAVAQGELTKKQGDMYDKEQKTGQGKGGALTYLMGANTFLNAGGASVANAIDFGKKADIAHMKGLDNFGTNGADKQAANAETDMPSKAILDARNLMQQVEAIQNNNFIKIAEGLSIALLTLGADVVLGSKGLKLFNTGLEGVSSWVAKKMGIKGLTAAGEAVAETAAPLAEATATGLAAPLAEATATGLAAAAAPLVATGVVVAGGLLATNYIGEHEKAKLPKNMSYWDKILTIAASGGIIVPDDDTSPTEMSSAAQPTALNPPNANIVQDNSAVQTIKGAKAQTEKDAQAQPSKTIVQSNALPANDQTLAELQKQTNLLVKIDMNSRPAFSKYDNLTKKPAADLFSK